MRRPGTGNGFVVCAQGHRHWGLLGAAGLLLGDGAADVLLQHRAPWTHEGGTWSIPGGARDDGEDAVTAALRESAEEAGLAASAVRPVGWSVADHGGWTYTTAVATLTGERPEPRAVNAESTEIRWWRRDEVDVLPLHAGFAAAWARLREPPRPLTVVVDVANVMGSRPDGWWRDRAGAATRWWSDLTSSVSRGWRAADLPTGVDPGPLDALTPRLRLVLEGAARDSVAPGAGPAWADALVAAARAPGSGDDAVVAETAALAATGDRVLVVTADRELRRRVAAAASDVVTTGPGLLLRLAGRDPAAPDR